jgi:hypothetical protein
MTAGRVVQVSVSPGGVPKTAVASARRTRLGLFLGRDHSRVSQRRHPGWSRAHARVLAGGLVRPGDAVVLLDGGAPAPVSGAP